MPVHDLSAHRSIALVSELQRRAEPEQSFEGSSGLAQIASCELFRELRERGVVARGSYGFDDRREITQVKLPAHVHAAESVAAVFHASRVRQLHDGFLRVRLETSTYGLHFELHEDERFWDQPHGALGAAVLVAPDLFVTVAHLLPSDLSSLRLVFGYRLVDRATPQTELFTTDVYKITRVVAQGASTPPGRDWALLQVDREVRGRIPVTIRRQGSIAVGARLYTLGHPGGLPLKFSDRARVRSIGANSFVTNLDYATHSSGSPVFNATDHVLEGLISQGERDNFVTCCDGRWRVTYHLEDDEGEGVTCTAASAFARLVP